MQTSVINSIIVQHKGYKNHHKESKKSIICSESLDENAGRMRRPLKHGVMCGAGLAGRAADQGDGGPEPEQQQQRDHLLRGEHPGHPEPCPFLLEVSENLRETSLTALISTH